MLSAIPRSSCGMTGAAGLSTTKAHDTDRPDNSTTGMTGQQENPGTGLTLSGEYAEVVDIADVLKSIGFQNVITVDPNDLKALESAIDEAVACSVPCAIILKRPCVLIKRLQEKRNSYAIDKTLCRSCKLCLRLGCPAISMQDGVAVIDELLCAGCDVCAQICPFKAIHEKGEEND